MKTKKYTHACLAFMAVKIQRIDILKFYTRLLAVQNAKKVIA